MRGGRSVIRLLLCFHILDFVYKKPSPGIDGGVIWFDLGQGELHAIAAVVDRQVAIVEFNGHCAVIDGGGGGEVVVEEDGMIVGVGLPRLVGVQGPSDYVGGRYY